MSYLFDDSEIDDIIVQNHCTTDALILELFWSQPDDDLCVPRWLLIKYLNKNYPHLTAKYLTLKLLA